MRRAPEIVRTTSLVAAMAAALAATACAKGARPDPRPVPSDTDAPRITILYDAFGTATDLERDFGYAALVEVGGKRILFDTGNDAGRFERNVEARQVDLTRLDFVVMSHRHGDHMAGMAHLLAVNPSVPIYAPNDGPGGVYGTNLPGSFYRQDTDLPAERRYFGGEAPEVIRLGSAWPGADIRIVDGTTEIAPGVHLIALVSDRPGTMELRELSLAIETPAGLVVVVGCSHPGIERIVEAATAIDPRIHLLVGGFHLLAMPDPELERIATALRDRFQVSFVAPGHCTGEPAFSALARAFGARYLYAGLGSTIPIRTGD